MCIRDSFNADRITLISKQGAGDVPGEKLRSHQCSRRHNNHRSRNRDHRPQRMPLFLLYRGFRGNRHAAETVSYTHLEYLRTYITDVALSYIDWLNGQGTAGITLEEDFFRDACDELIDEIDRLTDVLRSVEISVYMDRGNRMVAREYVIRCV